MMALLNVRVQPRASRSEVGGLSEDGVLRVRVTSPPSDGEANDAMLKLLAKHLGIARSALAIVRGESSRNKVIEVAGLTDAELRHRL